MGKFLKSIFSAAVLLMVMNVVMVGCSSDDDDTPFSLSEYIVGRWRTVRYEGYMDGEKASGSIEKNGKTSASYMEFSFDTSGRCTYGLWMQNSYGVSQWTTGEDPYYVHGNTVTIGTGSESLDVYFDEKSHELYLRGTSKTDYGEVLIYIYARKY